MARTSKYAEMAKAEADTVEAEDTDEDTDTDAEPEPETPPDESTADPEAAPAEDAPELSMEGRAAALETLLETYHGAAQNIFGAEWETDDNCPQCSGLGFVFPSDPVKDPDTEQCPKCAGHGVLITESQVPQNVAKQCERCLGNGYITKVVAPVFEVTQAPPSYMPPPPNAPAGDARTVTIPPMPTYDQATNTWRDPVSGQVIQSAAGPNGAEAPPAPVPS